MSEIVLSAEQMRLVADAKGPIMVRTSSGDVQGILEPMSPADEQEVQEIQARLGRPHQSYSITGVLQKLQSGSH